MTVNVLVTGGFGYAGGRVAQALSEAGCTVYLGTRRANLEAPSWLPQARAVYLDWADPYMLANACRHMDCVVHLAALNENESAAAPSEAVRVNGLGTHWILEAGITSSVQRFIYISTAHVYGSPLQGRIDETTLPRPANPYSITHRVAEDFVLAAHDKRRTLGIVARLANGFGRPAMHEIERWELVGNSLCRQAVTLGKLVMKSSGEDERNFVTLGDVGRAIVHFMFMPEEKIGNGIFNLASDHPRRVIDLVQLIAERAERVLGFRPIIEKPEATDIGPPMRFDLRNDKLKATGFSFCDDVTGEIDATLRLCRDAFTA